MLRAWIPYEIIADRLFVAQIFQLLLQSRATVHRSGRIALFDQCLHLAEHEAITVVVDPEIYVTQKGLVCRFSAFTAVGQVRRWPGPLRN